MSSHSSPFPSCFRPSTTSDAPNHHPHPSPPPPPPPTSGKSNLTTCLYQTELGLFSLTWSRSFLGHSLHLQLHALDNAAATSCSPISLSNSSSLTTLSFHLQIKPFIFWKKHGSKKLHLNNYQDYDQPTPRIQIFWDLSRAKFGSGPEPQSGFYIAVMVEQEIVLLVGDLNKQALVKTRARKQERINQTLVLRREHIYGNRIYTTKARFGGKNRNIAIDCTVNNDARLNFSIDNKRVLQIKRLKWKFRGNEKIDFEGVPIQVFWDVYNWLFEDINGGHAVFMFRFETVDDDEAHFFQEQESEACSNGVVPWQHNGFGMSGMEWRKMRRSVMRTTRSSSLSSISMSSASSGGGSSSIMEWASTEENELSGPNGFSLLVYAWKK